MQKKTLYFIMFIILVVVVVGIVLTSHLHKNELCERGVLVVNGIRTTQVETKLYKTYAVVPLVEVLKALDLPVEGDAEKVTVSISNKTFVLNVTEARFSEEGKTSNLLQPPPGIRTYYCCAENGDVFLDTVTLKNALFLAGLNIYFSVDREKGEVVIYTI